MGFLSALDDWIRNIQEFALILIIYEGQIQTHTSDRLIGQGPEQAT